MTIIKTSRDMMSGIQVTDFQALVLVFTFIAAVNILWGVFMLRKVEEE